MKKGFCALVLCLFLLTGCVKQPVSVISEVTDPSRLSEADINSSVSEVILGNDEYEYKIVNQSITIIKYKGNATDVVMPDEIDGYPVKAITEDVYFRSDVKTITLPKYIEDFGIIFAQIHITEAFIPDSVIKISDGNFNDCPRELVLLYDNNPLVPKYAEEHNIVCVKRSEYSPVLTVELVNGKPLNDEKNQGISQEDYNLIKRRNKTYIDRFMIYVSNEYITFWDDEEKLTDETIKTKLTKTATLLYQCGITGFDPADIKNEDSIYFDKMITFAIYSRSKEEIEEEDVKGSSGILFADDEKLYINYKIFFGIKFDFSKITGYSEQQKGIWYYQKEFPKVQTEALSFSGDAKKIKYTLKLCFTPESGNPIEKIFTFKLTEEKTVSGHQHRITLMGIK